MPRCSKCGHLMERHDIDPATGERTKCPVFREEKLTPPQEHERSPRGDY